MGSRRDAGSDISTAFMAETVLNQVSWPAVIEVCVIDAPHRGSLGGVLDVFVHPAI